MCCPMPCARYKALRQVEEAQLEELVTKQDLINPETRIDARLVAFEAKIIKWIVGLAAALFSALIAILLKLP